MGQFENAPARVHITTAARKHGIDDGQIRFVIQHCGLAFDEPAPAEATGQGRLVFLGDDYHGVPLEIIAVVDRVIELRVIHAMKLRRKYRRYYQEGTAVADNPVVLRDGTVLTKELEQALAREAEVGYDLAKATRVFLRAGRPAKGEPVGESPRIACRVPPTVYDRARNRARAEGTTLSAVLRKLLSEYAATVASTSNDAE